MEVGDVSQDETNPITLAVKQTLSLQQDLVVGLLFRHTLGKVGGVCVYLVVCE